MSTNSIYLLSPTPRDGTVALPMIRFKQVAKSIDFSSCDTLMFSSKQAVISANTTDGRWREFPVIAIGSATKSMVEKLGGEVIYQPKEFYADTLAKDIKDKFSTKKILYLRPKEVSFDSRGYLAKEGITLQEQILYETSCIDYSSVDKPDYGAIIIFTSPSSIHCFFKNFEWDSSYRAIIIGRATKEHLPDGIEFYVSDIPLIDSCISKAKEIQSY